MFTQTNALGTHTIMEACRAVGVPRIIHVSTDEVYGEVLTGEVDESGEMNPTNPYSASKAAAENDRQRLSAFLQAAGDRGPGQ